MELFYTTDISEKYAVLSEDESYHCIKILRHRISDVIHLTDGKGGFYKGKISKAEPKKCEVEIVDKELKKSKDYYLHIAIAPTKNIDRTEFFIEKAVETGVDEITFLKCDRSERKDVKPERLLKIAVSAMKQSKKAYLPIIHPVVNYKEFITSHNQAPSKYIASLGSGEFKNLKDIRHKESPYLILIGPEGDFSPAEVELALQKGFKALSLGENVLRTETAGVFVCSFINVIHQLNS